MYRLIILSIAACTVTIPLAGQDDHVPTFEDTAAVYEDLFEIKEPLNMTLKFSVKELQKTKYKETYLPAEMTCHVNDSFKVKHEVRVRARGEIRKKICFAPMFWVNIRHAGIEAEDLSDVIKMKVVTRCKGSNMYKNYVLKEYLVYQIWNLLSPYSFNTRLVRLKIIDTGRKNKEREDWAFIIEPEAMMVERNNCMSIKNDKLSLRTVNKEWMDRVAFFSYMVGQSDFSVTGRHNLKILTPKEYGPTGFIPVPYDFDYCGLVNAEYAIPGEPLGIESVTERYFLGACRSDAVYAKTIEWMDSYQDEIRDLIMNFEYLEEGEKKNLMKYIDGYFRESGQKYFLGRNISSTCL
ncbi:MAG: hypothetical protein U9R49_10690 [Bacteroidota bacterium]|nr:hypothetical protein [Bacteroidota bacterium]